MIIDNFITRSLLVATRIKLFFDWCLILHLFDPLDLNIFFYCINDVCDRCTLLYRISFCTFFCVFFGDLIKCEYICTFVMDSSDSGHTRIVLSISNIINILLASRYYVITSGTLPCCALGAQVTLTFKGVNKSLTRI